MRSARQAMAHQLVLYRVFSSRAGVSMMIFCLGLTSTVVSPPLLTVDHALVVPLPETALTRPLWRCAWLAHLDAPGLHDSLEVAGGTLLLLEILYPFEFERLDLDLGVIASTLDSW